MGFQKMINSHDVQLVNYWPNSTVTSLSPKCYPANVPLDFCTTADFEMKYVFNEGTAGVLGNTKLIF